MANSKLEKYLKIAVSLQTKGPCTTEHLCFRLNNPNKLILKRDIAFLVKNKITKELKGSANSRYEIATRGIRIIKYFNLITPRSMPDKTLNCRQADTVFGEFTSVVDRENRQGQRLCYK